MQNEATFGISDFHRSRRIFRMEIGRNRARMADVCDCYHTLFLVDEFYRPLNCPVYGACNRTLPDSYSDTAEI